MSKLQLATSLITHVAGGDHRRDGKDGRDRDGARNGNRDRRDGGGVEGSEALQVRHAAVLLKQNTWSLLLVGLLETFDSIGLPSLCALDALEKV